MKAYYAGIYRVHYVVRTLGRLSRMESRPVHIPCMYRFSQSDNKFCTFIQTQLVFYLKKTMQSRAFESPHALQHIAHTSDNLTQATKRLRL